MEPHSPWTREDRWALFVLVFACGLGFLLLVHPWHTFMNDGSIYLSTTRAMLRGEGYAYLGQPFHLRPIGFPLLLAPVMAAVDAAPAVLNRYVALYGVATLVLLFIYVRPRLGGWLALAAVGVVATNPIFLKLASQPMSDVPGLCFLLVALLVARRADARGSTGWELALGVAIAWAAHVRVLAILLLPAVLLARWLRWRREPDSEALAAFVRSRCLVVIIATVVVFAPWVVRNQLTANPPPADQLLNYSYSTALFHYDFGNPASPRVSLDDWAKRIFERGRQITAGLASRLQTADIEPHHLVLTTLLIGALFYVAVAAQTTTAFFLLFSLAMTGSYFAYQDRLLLPVFALLVPILLATVRTHVARFTNPRVANALCILLCLAVIALDFTPRYRWPEIEARHNEMLENRDRLLAELPPETRFATIRGFHYHMLLDRPVYSLRWSHRLAPGKQGLDTLISRYEIDTILLDPRVRIDREALPTLTTHYGTPSPLGALRIFEANPSHQTPTN
ncbi:MAG: glycosyltransferase family 39 protein [Myxococcota bacterium]|jgi:4-amino-4-deoxy-L-arabinose transferase-like glycosyltransferase|nr:glycosyltransferase family 39 protein [Myxococcota bacterium]